MLLLRRRMKLFIDLSYYQSYVNVLDVRLYCQCNILFYVPQSSESTKLNLIVISSFVFTNLSFNEAGFLYIYYKLLDIIASSSPFFFFIYKENTSAAIEVKNLNVYLNKPFDVCLLNKYKNARMLCIAKESFLDFSRKAN